MNEERVIIIDNKSNFVEQTRKLLLKLGFEEDQVWPPTNDVFTNWDAVLLKLDALKRTGFDPRQKQCYLLLDLALDEHNNTYNEGLGQIRSSRAILEDYVLVALTVWADPARKELMGTYIDGVIERTQTQDGDAGVLALKYGLEIALDKWARRTSRKPVKLGLDWFVADSPGARSLLSALSQHAVNKIVGQEAGSWSGVEIDALTGGHSGGHILRIRGFSDRTPVSVVCKISRDKESLEDEIERSRRAAATRVFVGVMAAYQTHIPKDIGEGNFSYIVQADVAGKSVEEVLTQVVPPQRQAALEILFESVRDLGMAVDPLSVDRRSALPALNLSEKDTAVFETSAHVLTQLLEVGRDQFGSAVDLAEKEAVQQFIAMVKNWNTLIAEKFSLVLHVRQHGDFNVRNLFISRKRLQLIDFARYAPWPMGYDLTRLEMQFLLRGIDAATCWDHFSSRMGLWITVWRVLTGAAQSTFPAEYSETVNGARRIALERKDLFTRLTPDYTAEDQKRLIALMRTFDAIKICSYQDASIFKRLWFLQIAIESARTAGLMM